MSTQLALLLSSQKKSSKLVQMQLERLGAHLKIFFLLATSADNEEYALTRKRSKSSKLRILIKAVLRCDRGGKWLDRNIAPGAGRKKLGLFLGFKGGVRVEYG